MPFRAANYVCLCADCQAPTQGGCLRCGQPLCRRHSPERDHHCADCEAEYQSLRRPIIDAGALKVSSPPTHSSRWPWLLLTGNTMVGLAFLLPADAFFALLLVVPMLSLAALEVSRSFAEHAIKYRQQQERRARLAFMAERKTPTSACNSQARLAADNRITA